jgi:hypothetical protein
VSILPYILEFCTEGSFRKSESVEEGLGSEREAVQEWKEDPELDIKRANAELGGYGEDIKGA